MRKVFTLLFAITLCLYLLNVKAQPITVQGHSSNATSGSTAAIDIPKPVGVQKNDLLIAHISGRTSSESRMNAPGWIKLRRMVDPSNIASHIFYKVATASEPLSYNFSDSGSTSLHDKIGVISVYRAVDTLNPINAFGGVVSASFTTPSIITTADSCMVLTFFGERAGSNFTPPTGMTENYDTSFSSSSVESICGDYVIQSLAGATGQKIATSNGNYGTAGIVALKPASHEVGIKNINAQNISFGIYPNPVSSMLNFNFKVTGKAEIIITNILGQEIFNIPVNSAESKTSINVSELQSGIYFCYMQSANKKSEVKKIIVSK
ncbi:MAG: T9SS type A sorting domain-containing protein [Bacteroidales bacterium]|nr:T9SS type A sorting domain-containing protein [Bacteroidales bacterium]